MLAGFQRGDAGVGESNATGCHPAGLSEWDEIRVGAPPMKKVLLPSEGIVLLQGPSQSEHDARRGRLCGRRLDLLAFLIGAVASVRAP